MKSPELEQLAKELGKRIAQKRSEVGLTQENVAELLQVGTEAVSRIERGVAIPSALRLIELADIFACPVEDFISTSSRVEDQSAYLVKILKGLKPENREFIINLVEDMAQHLRQQEDAKPS